MESLEFQPIRSIYAVPDATPHSSMASVPTIIWIYNGLVLQGCVCQRKKLNWLFLWFFPREIRLSYNFSSLLAFYQMTCIWLNAAQCTLRAINRSALSIKRAAPSRDLLLAQASTDDATIDGSRCAINGCSTCGTQASSYLGSGRMTEVLGPWDGDCACGRLLLMDTGLADLLPLGVLNTSTLSTIS